MISIIEYIHYTTIIFIYSISFLSFMLSGVPRMFPQEYYLRMFKIINDLMIPNKLYNARSIYALVRDTKYSLVQVRVMLNYARNNNLIHYDSNFHANIIYWKKEQDRIQFGK